MSVNGALSVVYLVIGALLWCAVFRTRSVSESISRRRWRDAAIATKVALGWPILLVFLALSRDPIQIDDRARLDASQLDAGDARAYLHRVIEAGSPPLHPLLGSVIASLVAASEYRDPSVLSKEEIDIIVAVADLAYREDGPRIERAVALLAKSILPGER